MVNGEYRCGKEFLRYAIPASVKPKSALDALLRTGDEARWSPCKVVAATMSEVEYEKEEARDEDEGA